MEKIARSPGAGGGGAEPAKRKPPVDATRSVEARPTAETLRALQRTLRRRPERAFDFGLVLGALLTVLGVIVILQNGERVGMDVLWWTWSTRLWVMLLIAVATGIGIGLSLPAVRRRQRVIRDERRQARAAVTGLTLPTEPSPKTATEPTPSSPAKTGATGERSEGDDPAAPRPAGPPPGEFTERPQRTPASRS